MNSKNYLVWGVVVLVVVLVGYYLVKGLPKPAGEVQNQSATTETASPTIATTSGAMMAKATIEYTDSGFSPKTVTVKVGDTVTWTNKAEKPMWVASAPHPTHTDLAGFDELSSVEKGGTYSFTFTKAGNWKYHNHMKTSDFGAVVVQ